MPHGQSINERERIRDIQVSNVLRHLAEQARDKEPDEVVTLSTGVKLDPEKDRQVLTEMEHILRSAAISLPSKPTEGLQKAAAFAHHRFHTFPYKELIQMKVADKLRKGLEEKAGDARKKDISIFTGEDGYTFVAATPRVLQFIAVRQGDYDRRVPKNVGPEPVVEEQIIRLTLNERIDALFQEAQKIGWKIEHPGNINSHTVIARIPVTGTAQERRALRDGMFSRVYIATEKLRNQRKAIRNATPVSEPTVTPGKDSETILVNMDKNALPALYERINTKTESSQISARM
jgi:hypothetical protein